MTTPTNDALRAAIKWIEDCCNTHGWSPEALDARNGLRDILRQSAAGDSLMQRECVNVRCNACDRSLVGVKCLDPTCETQGQACGLRPLLGVKVVGD
jgi:hypothetical protein